MLSMTYNLLFFLSLFLSFILLYLCICILKIGFSYLRELTWHLSLIKSGFLLFMPIYIKYLVDVYKNNFGLERDLKYYLNIFNDSISYYYKNRFLFSLDDSFVIFDTFILILIFVGFIYFLFSLFIYLVSYLLISIQSFHYVFLSDNNYRNFTLYWYYKTISWTKFKYWFFIKFILNLLKFFALIIFTMVFVYEIFYNNCVLKWCYILSIFLFIFNILIRLFLFFTLSTLNRQVDEDVQKSLLKNAKYLLSDSKQSLKYVKNNNRF